ncbi:MAG: hypothetical protein GY774_00260 [Planctomycetes bacterium]|nr:hypothetical protein [Planctomycetota bacterium]
MDENIMGLIATLISVVGDGDLIGIKHTVEQIMRSPESIWGFVIYMNLYVYSKVKSKDLKTIVYKDIKKKERRIVDGEIEEAIEKIEASLWHGVTALEQMLHRAGVYKMPINSNQHLVNASVSDIKRDYHTAYGKERGVITKKLLTEIYKEIETKEVEGSLMDANKATAEIDVDAAAIAGKLRGSYFDKIHKRSGCNDELSAMEERSLPNELLVDICKNVLTTAIERRIIRRTDEARATKELSINPVSVVKIIKTIFNKLGRSK